jgi:SAM-dependent methyltransferase
MLQLLLALIVVAQTPEPSGVAQIRRDAKAMGQHVTTDLARAFLRAGSALPEIHDRTLYQDVAKKTYLSEKAVQKLEAASRDQLKKISVDETFYYNTRYGSPLAYARPLELLGKSGLGGLSGRKILDFGCGGIGPMRMMASLGAEAVGVDVDPMLSALFSEPDDLGVFKKGSVSLIIGHYPADEAIKAKVGGGYDVILAKNTLKRGYVHPDSGRTFIDLGMSDQEVLKALFAALKPGGRLMIFNLGPAPNAPKEPYRPMADIRCPFPHDALKAAGFVVEAFDRDDTRAAREMGVDLGWNKGEGAMDLEKDLFASYSLLRKP